MFVETAARHTPLQLQRSGMFLIGFSSSPMKKHAAPLGLKRRNGIGGIGFYKHAAPTGAEERNNLEIPVSIHISKQMSVFPASL